MPASLFGDRFLGREPAWHRLGKVMDTTNLTATQAMEIADIGFPIDKVPTYAELLDGTLIETGQFAVVRNATHDDPEPRVLSTVGSQWTALQARDLATMLDPITKEYPVETAGALGRGEKIFFTLDAGEGQIAGEEHRLYYLVTDHRDGSGALSIAFTPVRVVCQNTLTVGLNQAKVSVSIRHDASVHDDAKFYMGVFEDMMRARTSITETMNQLAEVNISDTQAMEVVKVAYPDPSRTNRMKMVKGITPDDVSKDTWLKILNDKTASQDAYDKAVERVNNIRNGAWERYDVFNQEHARLSRTPWAIWQAIVETEDYRRGKDDGSSDKAILYGNRAEAKAKSFTKALELATS